MIRIFRDLKIHTKISLCISLVVAVPLIIVGVFFSTPLYNMVTASTIRDEQNALSEIVPQIDEKVDDISEYMSRITSHPYYQKVFFSEINDLEYVLFEDRQLADFKKVIDDLVETTPVNSVKIYIKNNANRDSELKSKQGDLFRPEEDVSTTYWHGIFDGTNYPDLYCPDYYLSNYEIENFGNAAYIVRANVYSSGVVYPAYIALYYDNDIYGQVLSEATNTAGSVSYIINDRNAVVVTTDKALSGTYRIKYSDIQGALLSSNNFIEREIAGVSVYVAFFLIDKTDWFMVNVIPKEPVIAIARKLMIRTILVFTGCFLFALVIAIAVSSSITKRISAVSSQMGKVQDGPPVAMEEPYLNDEVGDLIKNYNYMTREMNQLIKRQEETAEQLRFAEFNALQAQINPHFLYNTMDMINWMALQGRNKEVSEVVQNLSKFYKLTLSRRKDYSTIADELEHAEVYIELQNMRFNDAITFVVDVPDELTECRLPKLTFQPILENAILHGILETENKSGTIVLTIWAEDDDIHILVSDDGAGMDESMCTQILSESRLKPTNSRGANVAIVNIHRRLQLLYGEKYGLSYESSPGNGCDVTIVIPKHLGEESYVKNNN